MRGHASLLGAYVERESLLHAAPLWAKFPPVAILSVLVLSLNTPPVTLTALGAVVLGYLVGAQLTVRELVQPVVRMWPLILILGAFQWFRSGPEGAFTVVGNIVVCVLAALLVTLTTHSQRLLDGLVFLARPFRPLGVDPERLGLTIALMLRSIPYLVGAAEDSRDAARARGLERNPRALILPVFIGAVAYAHQTGEALVARGLADSDPDDRSVRLGLGLRRRLLASPSSYCRSSRRNAAAVPTPPAALTAAIDHPPPLPRGEA